MCIRDRERGCYIPPGVEKHISDVISAIPSREISGRSSKIVAGAVLVVALLPYGIPQYMIAERLGITVEWKTMSFDAIIVAVKNREIDLGVSGFSITPERLEEVLFTIPHTVTEVQLIMTQERASQLGIDKLTDLSDIAKYNLVVGTGSGTTQEDELLELVGKGVIPSASVKSYDSFDLALEDMLRGVIDAVYAETPVTTWWTMTVDKPLVIVYARSYWPVAFVAHKDAHELVAKINGVLAELIAEGKVDQLREKWSKPASS